MRSRAADVVRGRSACIHPLQPVQLIISSIASLKQDPSARVTYPPKSALRIQCRLMLELYSYPNMTAKAIVVVTAFLFPLS